MFTMDKNLSVELFRHYDFPDQVNQNIKERVEIHYCIRSMSVPSYIFSEPPLPGY